MALIELRNTTILIKDGLSGTGLINEATPLSTDTDVDVDTLAINRTTSVKIPIGARFTVSTGGNVTEYTVTDRTLSAGVDAIQSLAGTGAATGTLTVTLTIAPDPLVQNATKLSVVFIAAFDDDAAAVQILVDVAMALQLATYVAGDIACTGGALNTAAVILTYTGTSVAAATQGIAVVGTSGYDGTETASVTTDGEFVGQSTNLTFSPEWGTPTPADNDTITFLPIEVEVQVGEGNLTYTENIEYEYVLDRGDLSNVKKGDAQPMDISIDFIYEFVTTGTGEPVTVVDALKGIGGADEFTSASTDPCEPYAVDVEIINEPSECAGVVEKETTFFPDFRYDSLEFDLDESTISVTGRCNAEQPIITRG
jgi:hypothetical protein